MTNNILVQFFLPLFFALGFYIPSLKKCNIWSLLGAVICFSGTVHFVLFSDLRPEVLYLSKLNHALSYHLSLDKWGEISLLVNSFILLFLALAITRLNMARLYYFLIFFSFWAANATLYSFNLYCYYLFWEILFIPLFILIWSAKDNKTLPSLSRGLVYFSISSAIMLGTIIFMEISDFGKSLSENYGNPKKQQTIIFTGLTLAMLIRMPVFPFHSWFPKLQEKSPSFLLIVFSGFFINTAVCGLMRFVIPVFEDILNRDIIMITGIVGAVYCGFSAMRQTQIKEFLSWCQLVHTSIIITGLFTLKERYLAGVLYYAMNMILVSGGLFYLVSCLDKKGFDGTIEGFKKMMWKMPIFSLFFLFFVIGFVSLPLGSGFPGLFLITAQIYRSNELAGPLLIFSVCLIIICFIKSFHGIKKETISSEKIDVLEIIPMAMLGIVLLAFIFFPYIIVNHIGRF